MSKFNILSILFILIVILITTACSNQENIIKLQKQKEIDVIEAQKEKEIFMLELKEEKEREKEGEEKRENQRLLDACKKEAAEKSLPKWENSNTLAEYCDTIPRSQNDAAIKCLDKVIEEKKLLQAELENDLDKCYQRYSK